MNTKSIIITLTLFGIYYSTIAQTTLSGVVVDSGNQAVLSFVNIGIKQKNIGTSSLFDETFSIVNRRFAIVGVSCSAKSFAIQISHGGRNATQISKTISLNKTSQKLRKT